MVRHRGSYKYNMKNRRLSFDVLTLDADRDCLKTILHDSIHNDIRKIFGSDSNLRSSLICVQEIK